MRTEVDCATVGADQFATQVGRWLQLLERPGEPTPKMHAARQAAAEAMRRADNAGRPELFATLIEHHGVAAMEFAAQEGLAGPICRLAAAGADVNASMKSSLGITPLMFAAKDGHAPAVKALLDCGADPCKQAMGTNAVAEAIRKGHRDVVELLLEHEFDVASCNYMCGTLIVAAAKHNRPEYVSPLVERGVSPDKPDNLNVTPLVVAAQEGFLEVVQALLKAGASTELPPPPPGAKQRDLLFRPNDTPLIHAAKNGHKEIVRALIDAGAKLDAAGQQNMTAYDWARKNAHTAIAALLREKLGLEDDSLDAMDLIQATKSGDLETAHRAIAAGADLAFRDYPTQGEYATIPGRTALMHAAMAGQVEIARLLLEAGAPLDVKEMGGAAATVFEVAARHNQPEILRLILQRTLEPDDKMLLGRALIEAATAGTLDAVRSLIDNGLKVDARGPHHYTPLMAAAGAGRAEVVQFLLERGATVDLKSAGDFAGTALHSALGNLGPTHKTVDEKGNQVLVWTGDAPACVRLLLAAGADPNAHRKDGQFPLRQAAQYPEIVKALLAAGAEPNHTHKRDKTTALHLAVLYGAAETVRLLLDARANPTAVDGEGNTPLDDARKREREEIVALLVNAGAKSADETDAGRTAKQEIAAQEERDRQRWQAAAEADEQLRPDFSGAIESSSFKQAIKKLEQLCGQTAKRAEHQPALLYCTAPLKKARQLWKDQFDEFQRLGCYLFRCGRAFFDDDEEMLAIVPTTDQFIIVAARGTNGVNYEVFMSDVIAGLRKIYDMTPFQITKVAHDAVEADFTEPVADPKSMAKFLYNFCPDIVDQGVGTVQRLEQTLKKDRRLYLWWD